MHGPGFPQQHQPQPVNRPSDGALVGLRVLFCSLSLFSCGFLAWAAPLRIAVVNGTRRNWSVFAGCLALNILALVGIATDPTDDLSTWHGNLGMVVMLSTAVAALGWFLYADITYYAKPAGNWAPPTASAPFPGPYQQPQQGYGYPPAHHTPVPQPPVGQTPPHQNPPHQTAVPQPPAHQTPVPQQPVPPQRPQNHDIGQVRAELDELSELLRRDQERDQ
ncbi:hypothetical protein [Streptomyces sp. NPDC101132]|uniref:hypothetical protein n=1 Tax=Streptomyces sp. NPDC101132 TaxID=3366110 RepID=UPI003823E281